MSVVIDDLNFLKGSIPKMCIWNDSDEIDGIVFICRDGETYCLNFCGDATFLTKDNKRFWDTPNTKQQWVKRE